MVQPDRLQLHPGKANSDHSVLYVLLQQRIWAPGGGFLVQFVGIQSLPSWESPCSWADEILAKDT
jgi:hypothetical protein